MSEELETWKTNTLLQALRDLEKHSYSVYSDAVAIAQLYQETQDKRILEEFPRYLKKAKVNWRSAVQTMFHLLVTRAEIQNNELIADICKMIIENVEHDDYGWMKIDASQVVRIGQELGSGEFPELLMPYMSMKTKDAPWIIVLLSKVTETEHWMQKPILEGLARELIAPAIDQLEWMEPSKYHKSEEIRDSNYDTKDISTAELKKFTTLLKELSFNQELEKLLARMRTRSFKQMPVQEFKYVLVEEEYEALVAAANTSRTRGERSQLGREEGDEEEEYD